MEQEVSFDDHPTVKMVRRTEKSIDENNLMFVIDGKNQKSKRRGKAGKIH